MKKIKVREALNKFVDLIAEGKGDWDLIAEDSEGVEVHDVQITAVKPTGLEVLFG